MKLARSKGPRGNVLAVIQAEKDEDFETILASIEDALEDFTKVDVVLAAPLLPPDEDEEDYEEDDEDVEYEEDDEPDVDEDDDEDEDDEEEEPEEEDDEDEDDEDEEDYLTLDDLNNMLKAELKDLARDYGIQVRTSWTKDDIIEAIVEIAAEEE